MQIFLTGPTDGHLGWLLKYFFPVNQNKMLCNLIFSLELTLDVKSAISSFLFALNLGYFKGGERFREMTEFQGIISQKPGIADKWASNPG